MGIPTGAVRQALQKEGMDPNIIDMDPEKSYASQVRKEDVDMDPPLKEEYAKFFKVSDFLTIDIPTFVAQNYSYSHRLFHPARSSRYVFRHVCSLIFIGCWKT